VQMMEAGKPTLIACVREIERLRHLQPFAIMMRHQVGVSHQPMGQGHQRSGSLLT